MYKIMKHCGFYIDPQTDLLMNTYRRYNTKTFESYQAAKKYVRRLVTRLHGSYSDTYSQYGFTIQKV